MADSTVRPPTQVIWLAPSTVPSSDSAKGASGCAGNEHTQLGSSRYQEPYLCYPGKGGIPYCTPHVQSAVISIPCVCKINQNCRKRCK